MPEAFDPYHKWLGILPKDQPPNAYRLLGVEPLEHDLDAIIHAADQRMAYVRTFRTGEYSELSQRLLDQLAAARVLLLDPKRKAQYDQALSQQLAPPARPAPPPVNKPGPSEIADLPRRAGASTPARSGGGTSGTNPRSTRAAGKSAINKSRPSPARSTNASRTKSGRARAGSKRLPIYGLAAGIVALLAAVGWAMWPKPEVQEHRETPPSVAAIKALTKLGAKFDPPTPTEEHPPLSVDLSTSSKLRDDDLGLLKALPGLKSLNLSFTDVTDAGLAHLKSLKQLKELKLITAGKVTGAGMKYLAELPALETLDVTSANVDDAALQSLQAARPNLAILNARGRRVKLVNGTTGDAMGQHKPREKLADGWESLFDGKSLAGWKANQSPDSWQVEDGVLIGEAQQSGDRGYLFYIEDEFDDFEIQADVRLSTWADSGFFIRTPWQIDQVNVISGYEGQLTNSQTDPIRTGSLYVGPEVLSKVEDHLVADDTWFHYSLMAQGNRFVIKVDGRTVTDILDDQRRHSRGHIALQLFGGKIEFKNIAIKRLPAEQSTGSSDKP